MSRSAPGPHRPAAPSTSATSTLRTCWASYRLHRWRTGWGSIPDQYDRQWAESGLIEGDPTANEGGFLDLRTGEVIPAFLIDEAMVGADAAVDVDTEPD